MASLEQTIGDTLNPSADIRKNAESRLTAAAKEPGHLIQLLQLVDNGQVPIPIRQAAAIRFKNVTKIAWTDSASQESGITVRQEDRDVIKTNLVNLMCTVPQQIRDLVSAAICLIAEADYPANWSNLLPDLVTKFGSNDLNVVNGVLITADSIFKSFTDVQRSDNLYRVIVYTLEQIQEPLLKLFMDLTTQIDSLTNDLAQLLPRFEALQHIVSIYYSLVYQDLPAYFEDNMEPWMKGFEKFLQYQNPLLVDNDEEDAPGPIDKLQTEIIKVLTLFVERDEEPFAPYLPNITTLVWNLLVTTSVQPKHDQLTVRGIKYLSVLVGRELYKNMFGSQDTLKSIVEKIVIPNLMVRESDEENFEDNPQDYILTELEGSDNESRRRCSRELLGSMCRQFEDEATSICSEFVKAMIGQYTQSKDNWKAKDTAIQLMLGISIRRESSYGVSETNPKVDVIDFFKTQILPELQDPNHQQLPMLKATTINFVCIFRNQFSRQQLVELLPVLIAHLGSSAVAVHTLAANAIEKILRGKEQNASGSGPYKLGRPDIQPLLESLFGALFAIIENTALNENEYVMKCIMRTLDRCGEDVVPVTNVVFDKLFPALERVCKNPRNPGFNHNLFESIALLIKNCCSSDPSQVTAMENRVFPACNFILQTPVDEFTPYVFQILAQLLEYTAPGSPLSDGYKALVGGLLHPSTWKGNRGNVPGMTRLLVVYMKLAGPEIIASNQLTALLGIFQYLNSVNATDASAFEMLSAITTYVPAQELKPHFNTLLTLIFTKMLKGKPSVRYNFLATQYFALFCGLNGGNTFMTCTEQIQQGMFVGLLSNVWAEKCVGAAANKLLAKAQIVGGTRVLCECPALVSSTDGKSAWAKLFKSILKIASSPVFSGSQELSAADDDDSTKVAYDSTFSQLQYAKKVAVDPFSQITNPVTTLGTSITSLSQSQPGVLGPMIQQAISDDPKLVNFFETTGARIS